jgi:carbamoyl-phosphate synthase large subunit
MMLGLFLHFPPWLNPPRSNAVPARTDIKSILVLGSGPIVIGQACEFDYSGTQAVKALRSLGFRVVLVNSNPATIMTDPKIADATYIEPLTPEFVAKVIAKERPDALLPTVGGQTALNLAVKLYEEGVLDTHNVQLIGANIDAVKTAEDRQLFAEKMAEVGLPVCAGGFARTVDEGEAIVADVGFPAILRPAFTLGGEGGGIAYNFEEFREKLARGLDLSPVRQVLVERSVIGWKEFELEVMRDRADNAVVICSIENLDAMGVHTGDSITVAPAMTLTDREYQRMRDWAFRVIRAVGVETGGSNIQFAVHPDTGEMLIVEMNPRVSRSSALASKATGFPIAKIAAQLAVGLTLDEIRNDITRETPASFEPSIDYVVVKIPRWDFAKFPQSDRVLTTSMKSVGEVMALGGNFKEALQKAMRSLDVGVAGLETADGKVKLDAAHLIARLRQPTWDRLFHVREALAQGMSVEEAARLTRIDPWFVDQVAQLVECDEELRACTLTSLSAELLRCAKRWGYADAQLGRLLGATEDEVRTRREALNIRPVHKQVDTCAAEFEAYTPYFYSTYADQSEAAPSSRRKIMILGGGPIRIGQGIEFDDCCCQAVFALRDLDVESILVNCNPETVSTDYDTADRLYFDPVTLEDVLNIAATEQPEGVIVQFGGQTPLKIARALDEAGLTVLGTSPDAIDLAEDRERFGALLNKLNIPQPDHGMAHSEEEALAVAERIGYPVLLRPSYVLGGRSMVVAHDAGQVKRYIRDAVETSEDRPLLVDCFLEDAIEVDVDAVSDGETTLIAGVLQHIERAGVHSGDSSAVFPPHTLPGEIVDRLRSYTKSLAAEIGVRGLLNVQYAVKDGEVYVLEANPRASRTVPFLSKATGVAWAEVAARVAAGVPIADQDVREVQPQRVFVKDVVLPFSRFPEEDVLLGPEMKSTGEVMGVAAGLGHAFAKAKLATNMRLPAGGVVFLSLNDHDKPHATELARSLVDLDFRLICTSGTAALLREAGLVTEEIYKVNEGRPNIVDAIKNGSVQLIINTPLGKASRYDEVALRRAGQRYQVPTVTTLAGAEALVEGLRALRGEPMDVECLSSMTADERSTMVGAG